MLPGNRRVSAPGFQTAKSCPWGLHLGSAAVRKKEQSLLSLLNVGRHLPGVWAFPKPYIYTLYINPKPIRHARCQAWQSSPRLGKRSRQWSRILSHHMEQWKDSDSSLSMLIECLEYQCGQSFATGRTMGSKQWTRASGVSEFSYFLAQHIAWGCSQFHMFLAQTIQKDAGIMYIQLNCPWMGDANLAPLADSDDELLDLLTCHRSVLLAAT